MSIYYTYFYYKSIQNQKKFKKNDRININIIAYLYINYFVAIDFNNPLTYNYIVIVKGYKVNLHRQDNSKPKNPHIS